MFFYCVRSFNYKRSCVDSFTAERLDSNREVNFSVLIDKQMQELDFFFFLSF